MAQFAGQPLPRPWIAQRWRTAAGLQRLEEGHRGDPPTPSADYPTEFVMDFPSLPSKQSSPPVGVHLPGLRDIVIGDDLAKPEAQASL